MNTTPFWTDVPLRTFPAISRDMTFDAVVVGGGIAGVTTAYLMKRAGLRVALVERGHCAQGETAHTTAHLSAVTDRTFCELIRKFGSSHAQAIWDAGFAAIHQIDENIQHEDIECDFEWTEGYLHTSLDADARDAGQITQLQDEAACVTAAGFDAEYMKSIPGLRRPGVRFDHQAKFHALKYVSALVNAIHGDGSCVFEQSEVTGVAGGDALDAVTVTAGTHTLSAGHVVIATHVPIVGKTNMLKATVLQTDLYQYSTYAVRAKIKSGVLPPAMFWDMATPYYYLRVDRDADRSGGGDYVIFGGADHKTGQSGDERDCYRQVEEQLSSILPGAEITHRWSGQVIETRDGLPYIGDIAPRQFAMTGFSGNGITFSTLGAIMARDAVTGVNNPWRELFDINRTRIAKGLWDYLSENKDYPYYLIRDRFAGADGKSTRDVKRGEGKVVELAGEPVAVYRNSNGSLSRVSAVCTHMKCLVEWNTAESTWDCPCHGSRFTSTGKVIAGPAETPLPRM